MFLIEPEWTRVTSSTIEAVGYSPIEKRLRIRFRSGEIYQYNGVPSVVCEELLAAPSKASYFSEDIRPDYPYRRVRGAEETVPATAR